MKIEFLTKKYENSYMEFVLSKKESLMYYSLNYFGFLSELLNDDSECLVAVNDNDNVVGCMPIFYRDSEKYGKVANSLPYYGGHGGPIANNKEIFQLLLRRYNELMQKRNCIAFTIIGSPLEDYDLEYKEIIRPTYIDERIELMTYFPYESSEPYEDALMSIYHYKQRNSIRKAIKNDVVCSIDDSDEALEFLVKVHTDNMLAKGGLPKEKRCFELIKKHFKKGEDYNIFIARKEGINIAALLLFYFNGTVEYYTPAIVKEYRTYQPLALLIYTAMQDAMGKGYEKWNWGGTSISQESLYSFKSKWGTTETRYYYYTKINDESILNLEREKLMDVFSNYFVYPFDKERISE